MQSKPVVYDPLRISIACDRALMQLALKHRQRDLIGSVLLLSLSRRRTPPPAPQGLRQRLEQQVVDFELGHPYISAGVREVGDRLNRMGV